MLIVTNRLLQRFTWQSMELTCKVQTYLWGKKGGNSLVAKLQANADENFKIDEAATYAELWMGTHVNAPSVLKQTGQSLLSVVQEKPEYLGANVVEKFGVDLPYLFKVLSVNTALSIQAHPNKKHAEELHAKRPDIYKDPNHKPELAIALTPFEALCGFRPMNEIKEFIKDVPELRNVVGSEILSKYEDSDDLALLKASFRAVLTCCKVKLSEEINNMLQRYCNIGKEKREKYYATLIERLNKDFPNDPGCFMVYFLNYLVLKPHQAIFLAANEPHAYISGDCIECMACSDNVVRAGLTPKFIDVETLCSMLTYKGTTVNQTIFEPVGDDELTTTFRPPVPDFAVAEIRIPTSKAGYKLVQRSSGSILLVIDGKGKAGELQLKSGVIIFIPANQAFELSEISEELVMYQAMANV